MQTKRIALFTLAAVAMASANLAQAQTNLLSDGDFENFASWVPDGSYTTINANSPLGAWTVTGTSIDLIRNAWGSINDVSVDLSGSPGPGFISQTFNAVAGTTYTLSWDQFANSGSTDSLTVGFGGSNNTIGAVSSITHQTLSWTAGTSGVQTVSFGSNFADVAGPTVDNISLISAVPEPETYALLLAGLGCVGFVARRRRAN